MLSLAGCSLTPFLFLLGATFPHPIPHIPSPSRLSVPLRLSSAQWNRRSEIPETPGTRNNYREYNQLLPPLDICPDLLCTKMGRANALSGWALGEFKPKEYIGKAEIRQGPSEQMITLQAMSRVAGILNETIGSDSPETSHSDVVKFEWLPKGQGI